MYLLLILELNRFHLNNEPNIWIYTEGVSRNYFAVEGIPGPKEFEKQHIKKKT